MRLGIHRKTILDSFNVQYSDLRCYFFDKCGFLIQTLFSVKCVDPTVSLKSNDRIKMSIDSDKLVCLLNSNSIALYEYDLDNLDNFYFTMTFRTRTLKFTIIDD